MRHKMIRTFTPPFSTRIGALLADDPTKARAELVTLFVEHGTLARVAEHEDVPTSSVKRWISQLKEKGLKDPRLDARGKALDGVRRPKVQRSSLAFDAQKRPGKVREELRRDLRPRHNEGAKQARVRAAVKHGVNEITIRRVADSLGLR